MADSKGALSKAAKISSDLNEKLAKIKSSVSKFVGDMDKLAQEINEITTVEGITERMKNKKIADNIQKINTIHESAQKWVDDQLKELQGWMNEQIDKVESSFKKSAAREEVSILETAGKTKLDEEMVDKLAGAFPITLPRPSIPEITVPMPDISIPEIPISIPRPGTVVAAIK